MNPVILCLAIGAIAGPLGFALVRPDLTQHGRHIEAVTEVVLLFALFGAGLRLKVRLDRDAWGPPLRFAIMALLGTLLLAAGVVHVWLGIAVPVALLLAAILAPTDLPLGSDLRLPHAGDSEVRNALTVEAAAGAILAVPLALFALGMLGNHELGRHAIGWITRDLIWAVGAGLAAGWLTGALIWRKVLRPAGRDNELPEELIAVGTVAAACGLAMLLRASPFAAVFAAGLALAHGGRLRTEMGLAVRSSPRLEAFASRLERFGTVAVLLLLGALLAPRYLQPEAVVLALIVLTMARPLTASVGLTGMALTGEQRRLVTWFGMRGVISLYLLSFAVNHGLAAGTARNLTAIVVVALLTSVALHELTMSTVLGRRAAERA